MTGWPYREVDQLTLQDVEELATYWTEYPPLHLSVGAWLGSRAERKRPTLPGGEQESEGQQPSLEQLKAFAAGFGGGVVKS